MGRYANEIAWAALVWHKARQEFLAGATILDPTSKMARLEKPELLDQLAWAERALAAACEGR